MDTSSQSPAKAFFMGTVRSDLLFPYPEPRPEETETVAMVLDAVQRFMADYEKDFRHWDVKGEQPQEYLNALKDLGLFGLIIPEEFGGMGLSNRGYARVLQETSRFDASTSLTIGAHSSIGMKGILLYGSEDQKRRYLPRLASGETIAAFCLTEPSSGSDAASIKTNATKNPDGSWNLQGEKIWITNGAFAEIFTVFARTDGEEGKLTAFIVERGFGGVISGPKEDKMGIRASATTSVRFDGTRVPPENILGEVGKGFKLAMGILNNGRTGLGGGSVGAMRRCLELARDQALGRSQFGRKIADFELVQEKLAMMQSRIFVVDSVVNMVAHYIDSGLNDCSIEAAISKVLASESLWLVSNEALQIAGGNGYMREYPYERIVRDSRINLIFEGTNEILRLYVALSGLKDVGTYLEEIGKGASNIFNHPIKGFGILSQYAAHKMDQINRFPGKPEQREIPALLQPEAAVLDRYVKAFAWSSEALLRKLGKKIIGSQLQSKRIFEVAADLFAGYCTLSKVASLVDSRGEAATITERAILQWYLHDCKRRMNFNLRRLEKNEDDQLRLIAKSVLDGEKIG